MPYSTAMGAWKLVLVLLCVVFVLVWPDRADAALAICWSIGTSVPGRISVNELARPSLNYAWSLFFLNSDANFVLLMGGLDVLAPRLKKLLQHLDRHVALNLAAECRVDHNRNVQHWPWLIWRRRHGLILIRSACAGNER